MCLILAPRLSHPVLARDWGEKKGRRSLDSRGSSSRRQARHLHAGRQRLAWVRPGRGSGSGSAGFCLGPASPFHSARGRGRLLPVTKNRRRGRRERDGGEGGAGGSTGGERTPPRRPGKLHGWKRAHRHWVPRTGQGAVPGSKRETRIKAGAWHYLFLEC